MVEDAQPTVDNVEVETLDAQNLAEDVVQSQSKPISQNSEALPIPESPAEDTISTRRSSRRRPSISVVTPAPTPAPPVKKRGRGRPQKVTSEPPDVDPEQQSTPKEATPAVDETQPEEELPISAAIRRNNSKRKASFFGGSDSPRLSKRPREDSEPVDDDEQASTPGVLRRRPTTGRTEEQVALKRFQTVITMVHSQISQHRNGNIFHNPIKISEAPDYHDIVKRPIDLKTIKAKIKDGVIINSLEYQRDIYLMFANALMYNRPGSDVHGMAEDMMVESDSQINTFRQTEGYVRGSRV
ncbi:Bromodomain-containing protein [Mycena metata]|uniref:Bromodomain-containing protein n=1 Tax=Mycena metata TaxID=1033252 RepID=A0AAD7NYZ1_9AGAR|nr:Bromodomain-containing protein [Mycena metata]